MYVLLYQVDFRNGLKSKEVGTLSRYLTLREIPIGFWSFWSGFKGGYTFGNFSKKLMTIKSSLVTSTAAVYNVYNFVKRFSFMECDFRERDFFWNGQS